MRRRVLSILLGSFLLVTALLKLYSLIAAPFEPQFLLPHRWQHLVLIEVEVALGVWLLSGQALRAAKVAGIAFFALAAWASIYLGWIGEESCGCFGKVRASPWIALAVDLGCLTVLFFVRGSPSDRFVSVFKSFGVQVVLGACVILGLGAEAFFLTVQEPEKVLARWRGDILVLEPAILDAGAELAGKQRTVKLRVYNYSDRRVQIVGGTSSCSCVAIESLPLEIKYGTDIQVVINYKGSPGRFLRQFVLYTDHPSARVMYVSFRGEILKKPSEPNRQQGNLPVRASSPLAFEGGANGTQHRESPGHVLLCTWPGARHSRGNALSAVALREPGHGQTQPLCH